MDIDIGNIFRHTAPNGEIFDWVVVDMFGDLVVLTPRKQIPGKAKPGEHTIYRSVNEIRGIRFSKISGREESYNINEVF